MSYLGRKTLKDFGVEFTLKPLDFATGEIAKTTHYFSPASVATMEDYMDICQGFKSRGDYLDFTGYPEGFEPIDYGPVINADSFFNMMDAHLNCHPPKDQRPIMHVMVNWCDSG